MKREVATKGTMKEEEVQRLKRTAQLIMGKKPVRITHALVLKHLCIFGLIVPSVSVTECMRIGMTTYRLT